MDLLGSIMNAMDKNKKPPTNNTDKKIAETQKKQMEMINKKEKQILQAFREKQQRKITDFLNADSMYLEYPAMEKVFRQVIHNLAEDSPGLYAQSFGIEGENRYIVVYKNDYVLTDDEINARKNGDGWNETVKTEYALKRKMEEEETKEMERCREESKINDKKATKYKSKYEHLLATEAKAINETNKQYGFVPSENKKDLRTIEAVQNDIQQKKKLKTQHNPVE